jgi:hypothetical protein
VFLLERLINKKCFIVIAGLTRNPHKQQGIPAFAGMTGKAKKEHARQNP